MAKKGTKTATVKPKSTTKNNEGKIKTNPPVRKPR